MPEWYSEEIFLKLQDIVKIEYEIRSYTLLQKRLNGGTIIKRFIENIIINAARRNPRKIYLYSGHEVNIAGLVKALNFTEPQLPPYGCAMIFEKLRNKDGKHYVRVIFFNNLSMKKHQFVYNTITFIDRKTIIWFLVLILGYTKISNY